MTSNVSGPAASGYAASALSSASETPARHLGVERVRAGFPGARVTGVCMVAAPLLALAGTAVGMSSYHARGTDFVAAMLSHPVSFDLGVQLAEAGMVLLLVAVVGLATMICATRPGWGRAAGVVAAIGLCGPISFESIYWAASTLTDSSGHRAAAAVLIDQSQIIPRTVMNVTGPCLLAGFVLLGVAAAKSGVLPRWSAAALGLTALIPFGFISGHLVISLVGFLGTCVALVPLGLTLLRHR